MEGAILQKCIKKQYHVRNLSYIICLRKVKSTCTLPVINLYNSFRPIKNNGYAKFRGLKSI